MTERIQEDHDTLRVRVSTATVDDATRIADRIVEQRKAQRWRVIEVEVVAATGSGDGETRTVRWEHGQDTGRARGR